jgi:hypothetical protein
MHGMSLNINQMLGRFKIPFIVVIVILFGIEIGFGITRALISVTGVPVAIMIVVNSIIYSIVCFGFAIFFFVTAAKLMRILNKKSHGEKSKRARTLRRVRSIFETTPHFPPIRKLKSLDRFRIFFILIGLFPN